LTAFQAVTIAECLTNNDLREHNVDVFALEVPYSCFAPNQGVLNLWSATRRLFHPDNDTNGVGHLAGVQVSRMGNPLVNELAIGLIDKVRFNRQTPRLDANGNVGFVKFVTNPTLPAILSGRYLAAVNSILGLTLSTLAPVVPRNDLVAVFLTGIPTVNAAGSFAGEVMRLNTSIAPVAIANQNNLGIIGTVLSGGSDLAGYPNGRRPGDDAVDISLIAFMGALCSAKFTSFNLCPNVGSNTTVISNLVPIGGIVLTDGSPVQASSYKSSFPYFNTPTPGSFLDGAPGNVVTDPTICYPASQHGRCAICPSNSATSTVCSGAADLVPLSFLALFVTLALALFMF